MNNKNQIAIVGILGTLAVALGAFGAHTLKNKMSDGGITADQLNGFDTAVKYQMYHAIAMLIVVLFKYQINSKYLNRAYNCFLTGIVLFSGSLYFLTTRNLYNADFLKALGPVTPIGGLFFMAGWIMLIFAAFNNAPKNS